MNYGYQERGWLKLNEDAIRTETWTLINDGRFAEAHVACKKWAERGSLSARMFLGWLYHQGKGVAQDLDVAERFYGEAASLGVAESQFYLARLLLLRGRSSAAIDWLERAISHGYPPAAYRLSRIYAEGRIVDTDLQKSHFYLRNAVTLGHFFASKQMAVKLTRGDGMQRNVIKGLILFASTLLFGARMIFKDPYTTQTWYMNG